MFSLFKKKEPEIKVIDKVVIDETAKLKTMLAQWESDKNIAFVFWFDESLRQAELYFTSQTNEPFTFLTSREAGSPQLAGKTAIFAEHYPIRSKEEELYRKMNLHTVQVFSSLNEPLFKRFGSDKIIQVMKQLGMKDDEVIQHNLVSKAIRNAQEKIEKKVVMDQSAHSQNDWLEKNITA
jgi:phosphoribosylanthranilate isomerase